MVSKIAKMILHVLYVIETDEWVGIMIVLLIAILITAASKAWKDEEEGNTGDKEDRML